VKTLVPWKINYFKTGPVEFVEISQMCGHDFIHSYWLSKLLPAAYNIVVYRSFILRTPQVYYYIEHLNTVDQFFIVLLLVLMTKSMLNFFNWNW
jgi:hypothetical protein